MLEMQVSIPNLVTPGAGVWETVLAPREVRRLGEPSKSVGAVSVLVLSGGAVSPKDGRIQFDIDQVTVVNVGSTDRTIVIDGGRPFNIFESLRAKSPAGKLTGGDQDFLSALSTLPIEVRDAGQKLLSEVRNHFPGELKRVSVGRYQETPDNFWFVTIQPRAKSLLITVRGLPDRFQSTSLKVLEDRRPYSRFKIFSTDDVREASRIIRSAIRKP